MNIVAQTVGFAHFYYSLLAKIKGFSVLLQNYSKAVSFFCYIMTDLSERSAEL